MSKLIYITNTRMPSEKANTYQSIQMCHSFSKIYEDVEMWIPKLRNTKQMQEYENDPYSFYGIKNSFRIRKLFTIDSKKLNLINQFIWSNTKAIIFSISVLYNLKNEDKNTIIFTRDWWVLKILLFGKKIGIIQNKIFYEAHKFSKHLINNLKQVDGLIVINNYMKKLYEEKSVNNIFVSHDGVNINTFKSISKQDALRLLGLDKQYKYIVYVGRFNTLGKEKGIPQIIESLKYVSNNIKAIFIGGPLDNVESYYNLAKELYISKDKLIFIDRQPVTELYKYISSAEILLMPFPYTEHYAYYMSPLKMFEYMASKRPIIASNLPSICEILEDKKNAVLCEPDNPKDLANKIEWVLNNDCSKIVNQAYQDVQEYTWDKRAYNIKEFME